MLGSGILGVAIYSVTVSRLCCLIDMVSFLKAKCIVCVFVCDSFIALVSLRLPTHQLQLALACSQGYFLVPASQLNNQFLYHSFYNIFYSVSFIRFKENDSMSLKSIIFLYQNFGLFCSKHIIILLIILTFQLFYKKKKNICTGILLVNYFMNFSLMLAANQLLYSLLCWSPFFTFVFVLMVGRLINEVVVRIQWDDTLS